MSFWAAAAAMILVAVLCAVIPLIRPRRHARGRMTRDATVRELYRERLTELEQDAADDPVGGEVRGEIVRELDATLLAEYRGDDEAPPETAQKSLGPAVILAVIIPVAALFLYLQVGDPTAGRVYGAEALLSLDPRTDRVRIAEWQTRLLERVRARPEDTHSWYLLGRAALALEEFQRAAEAFAVVHALRGADPNVDVLWLHARYLAARGVIDETTRQIAARLLSGDPNQPFVLELLGVDAYRQGDMRRAVAMFERALAGTPQPGQRQSLAESLQQARAALGDLHPSIDVAVSAEGNPPEGATVFVIARPVGGGMPYAVVRRGVADLPGSVRLDDAVAMDPARSLSSASSIEVVVRLSRSGAPSSGPDDWEWRSSPIDVQALQRPLELRARLRPLAGPEPS